MVGVSCRNRVDSRSFGASKRHTAQALFDVHRDGRRGQTTSEQRCEAHSRHLAKSIDHRQKRFAWTLSSIR